jgi:hypothetical protein
MRQRTLSHGANHRYWVASFTLLTALVIGSTPAAKDAPATHVNPALQSDPALQQYRALRRMHAKSEKFNHEGWMEAWTELNATGFRYEIVSERGSDTIRKKVLRTLLERERELAANPERAELSAENYTFADETAGPGCRYILIKPKRKDVLLVDGRVVLSDDGRELLRVEGSLAKNPSFWTNSVNVIRHYARLDGVRVPIATESLAKVKFAGLSKLEVDYQYETINGRPVSVAARSVAARNVAARTVAGNYGGTR